MNSQQINMPILIGSSSFRSIRESSAYYVDKTAMIRPILEDGGVTSLYTRPRRFGKSLMLSMFAAFLEIDYANPDNTERTRELFAGTGRTLIRLASSPDFICKF